MGVVRVLHRQVPGSTLGVVKGPLRAVEVASVDLDVTEAQRVGQKAGADQMPPGSEVAIRCAMLRGLERLGGCRQVAAVPAQAADLAPARQQAMLPLDAGRVGGGEPDHDLVPVFRPARAGARTGAIGGEPGPEGDGRSGLEGT